MYKKLLASVVVLAGVAAVAQTVISWSSVNTSLAQIAQEVQAQAPYLTKLSVSFDPASDLAKDKVSLNLTAGTDQAIWGNGKAELATDITLSGQPSPDGKRVVSGTLNAGLATETLAAVRHFIKPLVEKCTDPASITTAADQIVCNFVADVNSAQKVFDVRVSAEKNLNLLIGETEKSIAENEAKLKVEKDAAKIEDLKYTIGRAQNELAAYKSVNISGAGDSLIIEVPYTFEATEPVLFVVRLEMQNESVSLNLALSTKVEEQMYNDYKQALSDALMALDQKSPEALEAIRDMAAGYAELIKQLITQ